MARIKRIIAIMPAAGIQEPQGFLVFRDAGILVPISTQYEEIAYSLAMKGVAP